MQDAGMQGWLIGKLEKVCFVFEIPGMNAEQERSD